MRCLCLVMAHSCASACQPASQHACIPPADAGRPVQEDSIRTDDLLERIQDSGRFSRHSIAGSEPSSAELPNGQLAPQASWALRRRSADQSASSLKRAREAVQSQPLALRLDVLAGPTMDQAGFQSQVGVSEVRLPCAERGSGGGSCGSAVSVSSKSALWPGGLSVWGLAASSARRLVQTGAGSAEHAAECARGPWDRLTTARACPAALGLT